MADPGPPIDPAQSGDPAEPSEPTSAGLPSVALVLGAGGVAGAAFHAGALAALHEVTGWDPRQADLVVGTSAGAGTAASLRCGLSAPDHLARATGAALSPAGAALLDSEAGPPSLDELEAPGGSWLDGATRLLPQAPWLMGPALLRPGPTRWGVAVAGLAPAGRLPTEPIGRRVRAAHPDRWPTDPTWIVAYRTRDARRVVFGRDDVEVPDLATAVEASSAVPGRFRPVRLDSGRYLDGAVYSPTNAEVVARLAFDLVVVSSPMSARAETAGSTGSTGSAGSTGSTASTGSTWSSGAGRLAGWPRGWFGRLLAREVKAVRDGGAEVLVLEPGPAELAAIRADLPDRQLGPLVAQATYEAVAAALARDPGHGPGLDLLARASQGPTSGSRPGI